MPAFLRGDHEGGAAALGDGYPRARAIRPCDRCRNPLRGFRWPWPGGTAGARILHGSNDVRIAGSRIGTGVPHRHLGCARTRPHPRRGAALHLLDGRPRRTDRAGSARRRTRGGRRHLTGRVQRHAHRPARSRTGGGADLDLDRGAQPDPAGTRDLAPLPGPLAGAEYPARPRRAHGALADRRRRLVPGGVDQAVAGARSARARGRGRMSAGPRLDPGSAVRNHLSRTGHPPDAGRHPARARAGDGTATGRIAILRNRGRPSGGQHDPPRAGQRRDSRLPARRGADPAQLRRAAADDLRPAR